MRVYSVRAKISVSVEICVEAENPTAAVFLAGERLGNAIPAVKKSRLPFGFAICDISFSEAPEVSPLNGE